MKNSVMLYASARSRVVNQLVQSVLNLGYSSAKDTYLSYIQYVSEDTVCARQRRDENSTK